MEGGARLQGNQQTLPQAPTAPTGWQPPGMQGRLRQRLECLVCPESPSGQRQALRTTPLPGLVCPESPSGQRQALRTTPLPAVAQVARALPQAPTAPTGWQPPAMQGRLRQRLECLVCPESPSGQRQALRTTPLPVVGQVAQTVWRWRRGGGGVAVSPGSDTGWDRRAEHAVSTEVPSHPIASTRPDRAGCGAN